MVRPAFLGVAFLALWSAGGLKGGCNDASKSLVDVPYSYYGARDMRRSVAIMPQKGMLLLPDSGAVPLSGRERVTDREILSATLSNPTVAADLDSSVARGEARFNQLCATCHGRSLAGDGPAAALFMPPPDLLGATTRGRSDGYLYSYIRNGGAVMPSYGAQTTPAQAWDIVNYVRQRQKASPR